MNRSTSRLAACVLSLATCLGATDYGVSAIHGNDANPGTLAAPFKTLAKAFAVARSGDRVFVLPGRYSPRSGETFPLVVASGVRVLGTDPRTSVIDAEFDPTVPNPKDPTVNPVQGTILQIGTDVELARLGIVNGPRDPGNPGSYWWTIAVVVADGAGNADNAHIHHCILDEFSRGIFVGGPGGSHDMKNVRIDNCVLTRFYVEAINATASGGTASGNRIFNCTVVGHRNPATSKNFGRACMSFGTDAQFDVRNCVVKDGDWAGIEAVAQSNITSDHNCLHGSGAALRGVTKGANDIESDPMLARLPSVTAMGDPHHAAASSPLFEAGTNIVTTGGDIDFGGVRLVGAFVDIGADEFQGTDTWFNGTTQIGGAAHIGMLGTANGTVLFGLSLGSIPPVSIPGILGQFELDLSQPHVILAFGADARGFVQQPVPIPNDTNLLGIEIFLQCLDVPSASLSDLDRVAFIN